MDWNLNFQENNFLELKTTGELSIDGLTKMVEHVVSDPKWRPGMNVLADFREVGVKGFNVTEIYKAKDIHIQYNDIAGEGRIAIILKSNLAYGFSRMYQAISSSHIKSQVMTFRNYDHGIDWIKGKLSMEEYAA